MNKCPKCKRLALNNDVKNNQEILSYFKSNPKTQICSCDSIRLVI